MYSIYADGVCFYKDSVTLEELKLLSSKLTLSENAAGSLEITVPATNVAYSGIKKFATEIVVLKDDVRIWSGRPISENIDFQNNKRFYCEGELAYLNDSIQSPAEYTEGTIQSYLDSLLQQHNAQVSSDKQFILGAVTVVDPTNAFVGYTNYEKTIYCISEYLIKSFSGLLRIRYENGVRYLDYLQDYPNTSTQTIEFGKNLLDLSQSIDMGTFTTAIIPLGAEAEIRPIEQLRTYLTIEAVNNNKNYIQSDEAVAEYGYIATTVTWDDITDATVLLERAQLYLTATQFENVCLEVSAVDMHYLNPNIETINILDQIRVISAPHGMNRLFPVTSLTIVMNDPGASTFTLGSKNQRTLSSTTANANQEILNKIGTIPTKTEVIDYARQNATQLITSALNGFVTIVPGENGSQELIISSESDYMTAQNIWRWNINGLGFSSTGYDGTYETAITMDGTIVGNKIVGELIVGEELQIRTQNGAVVINKDGFYSEQLNTSIDGLNAQLAQLNETANGLILSFTESKTDGTVQVIKNAVTVVDSNGVMVGSTESPCQTAITPESVSISRDGVPRITITETETILNKTTINDDLSIGPVKFIVRPDGCDICYVGG